MTISVLHTIRNQKKYLTQVIDTSTDAVSFYSDEHIESVLENNKENKDTAVFYIDSSSYVYYKNQLIGKFNMDFKDDKSYSWNFKSTNKLIELDSKYTSLIDAEKFVISKILNDNLLETLEKKPSLKI